MTPDGVAFTAILRDVTERKSYETALEARVEERTADLKSEVSHREATQEAVTETAGSGRVGGRHGA